jgi:cytochrome c
MRVKLAPQQSLSSTSQMAAGRCMHCDEDFGTHAAVFSHMNQAQHFKLPIDASKVRNALQRLVKCFAVHQSGVIPNRHTRPYAVA